MKNNTSLKNVADLFATAHRLAATVGGVKIETTEESWLLGDDTIHRICLDRTACGGCVLDWEIITIVVRRPSKNRPKARTSVICSTVFSYKPDARNAGAWDANYALARHAEQIRSGQAAARVA